MAFKGSEVSVPTTGGAGSNGATKIIANTGRSMDDPIPALIKNTDAANTLYLGGPAVANSGGSIGYPLAPGEVLGIDVEATDELWAIAATAAITVGILLGRQ